MMFVSPRLCALSAALLAASVAQATTVVPPSFPELVSKADAVVDAEVTAVRSEFATYEGHRLVYTYVTLEVIDVLKGAASGKVELRLLGGTVGDFSMKVEGVPEFHRGDRDLLFVEGNGLQFCPLVAVMHGRYPIVPREGDGADIVLRNSGEPLATVEDVQRPMSHGSHLEGSAARPATTVGGMTLVEFKTRVREEVARGSQK